MLNTLGRGLAPIAVPSINSTKKFIFTRNLPPEVTFTRNSKATCRNANGKLVEVGLNEARIDHHPDGTPLGLFIETTSQNKCANYNINPIDTTGLSASGIGTLTVVDDTAQLLIAGLEEICTTRKVFKAVATTGSDFTVTITGATGNTSKHSMLLYARGEGSGDAARIGLGGTELSIASAGNNYAEFKYENITPASTTSQFTITVNGNQTLYFILNQLEQAVECSSIIPVEGSAVTRPTERARILGVDQASWFNILQGHMICRYTLNKQVSGDGHIVTFNSGSSANFIGFRVSSSLRDLKGYVRANSSNLFSLNNEDIHITGVMNTAGIRWNNTETEIISGGKNEIGTLSATPTGITELEIGARNGGNNAMNGHIATIEIGKEDITTEKLGSLMHKSSDQVIAIGGESLARGYFESQEGSSEAGKQKIREILGATYKDKAIVLINGTMSGSAASKTSNDTTYWWNLATQTRGPSFDNFYQEINKGGTKPTYILWAQGEEDSDQIGLMTSPSQYKQALEFIFNDMRQALGNIPIYIQPIGRRTDLTNAGGAQSIRDIQAELIAENDWCREAAEIYDLDLFDSFNLTDTAYITAAERTSGIFLNQSGSFGPSITTAQRSGTIVTVTLAHDSGNDFMPVSGIEGFKFFDDTVEIAITNAVKTNGNTITLTLATPPSSSNQILYYGYDDMGALNTANIVKDNATPSMPLRTAKISY